MHLVLYRHQSTGVNGLKVREQGSTWSFVRSFGLFSARRGDNFLTMLPEFPIVACRDPLLEPCSGDADSLLLNIRVKCLSFMAKAAHISGHLPFSTPLVIGLNVRRNQPQSSNVGLNVRSSNEPSSLYCSGSERCEAKGSKPVLLLLRGEYSIIRK